MALSPDQQAIVDQEQEILSSVLESLRKQAAYSASKFTSEQDKSREMNASIVASYRAEEKAMLASDEAVAHALSQKKKADLGDIQKLLKRPYFGRIVVEEERPQGTRTIEYKLGLSANPDCRIIDWRSAPISKLYYEYREGDDYEEEILGQERIGTIMLRRTVEIEHGVLKSITTPQGSFEKRNGEWFVRSGSARSTRAGAASTLTDVLPLVSPEQFRMITEEAETAILIQGIAGSGKTTVALHRLSWLMQARKDDMASEDVLVLLFSRPLQRYIQSMLPAMDLQDIQVVAFSDWAAGVFKKILPAVVDTESASPRVKRPAEPIPARIQRLKISMALLDLLEKAVSEEKIQITGRLTERLKSSGASALALRLLSDIQRLDLPLISGLNRLREGLDRQSSPGAEDRQALQLVEQQLRELQDLTGFYQGLYQSDEAIVERDETRLIDRTLIAEAGKRTLESLAAQTLDAADEALLLRLYQLRHGLLPRLKGDMTARLKHIIADEVQDYAPAELATIVAAVEHPGQLTLVGDVDQSIRESGSFPGWEKLKQRWKLKDSIARAISLTVSYRSTLPIMKLADRILQRKLVTTGREGRVPIWFFAKKEDRGIEAALKWLEKAMELYPTEMSAVLCTERQEARQILSLLKPRFGNAIRLGDDHNFTFEEGIVVSTVSQVKGLEFANVLLWNPDRDQFPMTDQGRNLLYVAVTRAIENLSVVSWKKHSQLLPHGREGYMRMVDLTIEEEEEPQEPEIRYAD